MAQLAHDGAAHGGNHEGHPGELTYIKVAIILAVITVAEVAIYYVQWMHDHHILVPALLVLSVVKFFTVVAYFMHLRFDPRLLTYTFLFGLLLGLGLVLSFMGLFKLHELSYARDILASTTSHSS